MDISVIVPVYNGESTLSRCLDSILAQTHKNFELIIVDDGSKDGSLLLLKNYAAIDKRIVLVSKANGGVSSARNVGLRMARGKYVQFVDADDDIAPQMFETMLSTMQKSGADVVTCRFKHDCWKPFLPAGEYMMSDRKDCLRFFSDFFTFNVPWNKLIKRSLITSYFNESIKIFEDGLFFLDNMANFDKVVVLDDVFYNYFNATSAPNSAVNAFLKTRFWETKEGYWFKQLLVKRPFEEALERLGVQRPQSFIRTRMFDMAFIELVKLIASDVCEQTCLNEMFAIFSDAQFIDSLELFSGKTFQITMESTHKFIQDCFETYRQITSSERSGEPFFEYIDHFFSAFCVHSLNIKDIIHARLALRAAIC